MISKIFGRMRWTLLVPLAIFLGLAPFVPEPHLVEKGRMLISGQLNRPMDIFDLFLHGTPLLLILGKIIFGRQVDSKGARGGE